MFHYVMTEIGEGEDRLVLSNRLTDEQYNLYNELRVKNRRLRNEEAIVEVFKRIPHNKNIDNRD